MIFAAHNRDVPEFKEFWRQEKVKWDNGIKEQNLEVFGDMNIYENGGKGFIHYSSISELKSFIYDNSNFKIVEYVTRSELIDEPQKIKKWSSDTVFWILKKEM